MTFNRDQYNVVVAFSLVEGWGGMVYHIKVTKVDGSDGIPWDHLQIIKNEVAGEEATAIEVYPRESDLVNEANMRHLWVVPEWVVMPNLKG